MLMRLPMVEIMNILMSLGKSLRYSAGKRVNGAWTLTLVMKITIDIRSSGYLCKMWLVRCRLKQAEACGA
jgi:hypothetical protein